MDEGDGLTSDMNLSLLRFLKDFPADKTGVCSGDWTTGGHICRSNPLIKQFNRRITVSTSNDANLTLVFSCGHKLKTLTSQSTALLSVLRV